MAIGVDLLSQFGQITLDFKSHTVQFCIKGRVVKLQGIEPGLKLNLMTAKELTNEIRSRQDCAAFLYII